MSSIRQGDEPADPGSARSTEVPSSARQVPHVTENDKQVGTPDRHATGRPGAPASPANASGVDKVDVDDQSQPIDPASMYDRRPGEDKNRSTSVTP